MSVDPAGYGGRALVRNAILASIKKHAGHLIQTLGDMVCGPWESLSQQDRIFVQLGLSDLVLIAAAGDDTQSEAFFEEALNSTLPIWRTVKA